MKRRPGPADLLSLAMLRLSRIGRHRPRADAATDSKAYYDTFFKEKDIEGYALDPRMAVRMSTLRRFFRTAVPADATVLDVGSGMGEVIGALPTSCRRFAMDYIHKNCRVTRGRSGDLDGVFQGSITHIPVRDGTMDVCLCLEVLEHIPDDGGALREMHRVLSPGGYLIAAVPYTYYFESYLKLMGHYRHYDRDGFRALLEARGFEVVYTLNNYAAWHQAFTRRYVMTRILASTLGRLTKETDVYRFRYPGGAKPALARAEEGLRRRFAAEARALFSTHETATFVAARKV